MKQSAPFRAEDAVININQLWQHVLADLRNQISAGAFENWVRNTRLTSFANDTATIAAPNAFGADTVEKRYGTQIERALSKAVGRPVAAHYVVQSAVRQDAPDHSSERRAEPRPARKVPRPPAPERDTRPLQPELESAAHGLVPRLTFETYVVGSSNRLAHAAAQAIAEHPGLQYNPFFVHGGVGLGKTHLLHAVGHRALEINPELTITYVTSETFTNEVIVAIRKQQMDDFRRRYRSIDILMVDDIQFIAGKESTQEEFFHTFNALYQSGKQVIVSSDKPPRAIAKLEERMRSRFAGGLIADVQTPDFEMRTAILRSRADELRINLPDDVIEYIAHRDQANIRELEGALNKILMMSQLYNRRLTLGLAMEALTDSASLEQRKRATSKDVIESVAETYRVNPADLLGRKRNREIAFPRQVAMYLLREETGLSLDDVGQELGGRDHTTVMHALKKIESALETDVQLRATIMTIREQLVTGQNG